MVNPLKLNISLTESDFAFAADCAGNDNLPNSESLEREYNEKIVFALNEYMKSNSSGANKEIRDYFQSRGVNIPKLCNCFGWRDNWAFPSGKNTNAIMAAIHNSITNEFIGLHLTYMKNCEKWGRGYCGHKKGGVVMLSPSSEVQKLGKLGIGEGIETSLSINNINGYEDLPIWAAMDSGNLGNFQIPDYLNEIIIAVDNDKAGIEAANKLKMRAINKGLKVTLLKNPIIGKDLNDLVLEGENA